MNASCVLSCFLVTYESSNFRIKYYRRYLSSEPDKLNTFGPSSATIWEYKKRVHKICTSRARELWPCVVYYSLTCGWALVPRNATSPNPLLSTFSLNSTRHNVLFAEARCNLPAATNISHAVVGPAIHSS